MTAPADLTLAFINVLGFSLLRASLVITSYAAHDYNPFTIPVSVTTIVWMIAWSAWASFVQSFYRSACIVVLALDGPIPYFHTIASQVSTSYIGIV